MRKEREAELRGEPRKKKKREKRRWKRRELKIWRVWKETIRRRLRRKAMTRMTMEFNV